MQYLLTEEELNALEPKAGADILRAEYDKVCLLVARATRGSCIHDDKPGSYGYCDGCGMANLNDHEAPSCSFSRNFSK